MYIITGKRRKVYSRILGRQEIGYLNNGLYGLIGFISGFWVRDFDPSSEKYKSLTTSLKDLLESLFIVLNLGMGIETIEGEEILVIEDLKHFYRERTVVRLPMQISNSKRKINKKLYFSGLEIGYNKGGDYENEIGLDEPNTKTSFVTPIRKSENKYKKSSKIRADEYAMEIARRKPQINYPDEDTRYDEHIWFLDLKKRVLEDGDELESYEQLDWQDRLVSQPVGIHSPNTFRSMLFTPLRILLRHGWVLRAGMEQYQEKFIKFISGKANTTLGMHFTGEAETLFENQDIEVSTLERSRFETEEITFNHPVNDELLDLILGKTIVVENGIQVEVPNIYFKFEWVNENGEIEKGYLMELNPEDRGKFKMMKSNENII